LQLFLNKLHINAFVIGPFNIRDKRQTVGNSSKNVRHEETELSCFRFWTCSDTITFQ